ncbi:MAG: hypothetical protein MJZ92_04075 [Paludibacteraceae bacterium]|nr:hypothetical protein [Paludibacteraceae bacterium]
MWQILLSIVTFTVSSRTSIDISGDMPKGAEVECVQSATTGTKTQLTQGNSMTFNFLNWQGQEIQRISLEMKSNKKSGAGWLTFSVNNSIAWEIKNASFASSVWHGNFSEEWVEVSQSFSPALVCETDKMQLVVEATSNSLYVASVSIEYKRSAPTPYTVDFVTNTGNTIESITEQEEGSGIVLPPNSWENADWHFVGWTKSPVEDTKLQPDYLPAGTTIYPQQNQTFYALYQSADAQEGRWQLLQPQSGKYLIGCALSIVAYGGVEDAQIATIEASIRYSQNTFGEKQWCLLSTPGESQAYGITFLTDSTATIQHIESEQFIWHNKQNHLSASYGEWNYRLTEDSTWLFYYRSISDGKMYALYPYVENLDDPFVFRLEHLGNFQSGGILLFPYNKKATQYTSYPLGHQEDVHQTLAQPQGEFIVPFGIYEIHIIDGKKSLRLRN